MSQQLHLNEDVCIISKVLINQKFKQNINILFKQTPPVSSSRADDCRFVACVLRTCLFPPKSELTNRLARTASGSLASPDRPTSPTASSALWTLRWSSPSPAPGASFLRLQGAFLRLQGDGLQQPDLLLQLTNRLVHVWFACAPAF